MLYYLHRNMRKFYSKLVIGASTIGLTFGGKSFATEHDSDFTLLRTEVENIYDWGFGIAVGLAIVFVTLGGIRYSTAQGNSSKVGAAKEMIYNALIGLGIAILGYAIITFLGVSNP